MKKKSEENHKALKSAAKKLLLSPDSPYKPKIIKRKDQYSRKLKHKGKDDAQD